MCIALFLIISVMPIPKGSSIRWIVTNKISNIARGYSNIFSSSIFLPKDDMDWFINANNYNKKHFSNLKSNDEIIYIDFHKTTFKESEPVELYAVFESFLYLRGKELPYNIVAIGCEHMGGVWSFAITTEDFEELYSPLKVKTDKRSEIAKELAKVWVEKNFYNRRGLILDKQDEYKKQLVTLWSFPVNSSDDNFQIYYFAEANTMYIDKKERFMNDYATKSVQAIKTDETGFMYAAWDEKNNIWMYGESTGLSFFKFDGASNWEKQTAIDESQMPYALKKVKEFKVKD